MTKNIYLSSIALLFTLAGCSSTEPLMNKSQPMTANTTLNVSILKGTALSQKLNTPQTYQPINMQIRAGSCSTTAISLANNETVPLKSCYQNNALLLDIENSQGKKISQPILFYYNPLWQQGFSYTNINTNGVAHLTNATVKVQMIITR